MQIFLSTLTEVDYERSLDSIEQNYDQDPEMSWKERARVKNLRKSENYNSELEVIAKNDTNDVIGHVLLGEILLVSNNHQTTALAVGALSVQPDVREQGLGKALMQAVEERAKAEGYPAIFVHCYTEFFNHIGYVDAKQYDIVMEELGSDDTLSVKFLTSDIASLHGMTVMLPEVFD